MFSFWGWGKYLAVVDEILSRAKNALPGDRLVVGDLDMENEVSLSTQTVQARLFYDTKHGLTPGSTVPTDVFAAVQEKMTLHGYSPTVVTASAPTQRSNQSNGSTCSSVSTPGKPSGIPAGFFDASQIVEMIAGRYIGLPAYESYDFSTNQICGGDYEGMFDFPIPIGQPSLVGYPPTVTNIHIYPCVEGDGFTLGIDGCNHGLSTQASAKVAFDDVWTFISNYGFAGNRVVLGEVHANQNCDYTRQHAIESIRGYKLGNGVVDSPSDPQYNPSSLFANRGYNVTLRPWNNVAGQDACHVAPSFINEVYRVF